MYLSVIIPIYNVEKYLKICVDSVLNQDFNDYEIILVNDGSTDESKSICDDYKKISPIIKVIHKENGGASDARNCGIINASGDYLLFVDADDYIEKNSIKKIVDKCNHYGKPEVMLLNIKKVYDHKVVPMNEGIVPEKINNQPIENVMEHIAQANKFPGSPWSKLVSRKFIIENNLFFEKGLLSEDIDWVITILSKAKKIACYNDGNYYYYRQGRKGSVTNNVTHRHINSLLYIIKKWIVKKPNNNLQRNINSILAYEYSILIGNYMLLTKQEQEKVIDNVFNYFWVLEFGKSKKTKFIYYVSKFLGEKNTTKLLMIYMEKKRKRKVKDE